MDGRGLCATGFRRLPRRLPAPAPERRDGCEHLVLFPLYTPNASSDTRFEALIMRMPWPDWLAGLERTAYHNSRFVPGHFVDHTAGYDSECAVLFPETVSLAVRPSNNFATIFCDREARRVCKTALPAPPGRRARSISGTRILAPVPGL